MGHMGWEDHMDHMGQMGNIGYTIRRNLVGQTDWKGYID